MVELCNPPLTRGIVANNELALALKMAIDPSILATAVWSLLQSIYSYVFLTLLILNSIVEASEFGEPLMLQGSLQFLLQRMLEALVICAIDEWLHPQIMFPLLCEEGCIQLSFVSRSVSLSQREPLAHVNNGVTLLKEYCPDAHV